MRAVLETQKIEVDETRVKKTIEDIASSYQDPEQLVNWYYSNDEQMSRLRNMVLEEQLIESIVESANVKDVELVYDEAIKVPQPEEGEGDE